MRKLDGDTFANALVRAFNEKNRLFGAGFPKPKIYARLAEDVIASSRFVFNLWLVRAIVIAFANSRPRREGPQALGSRPHHY